MRRIFSRGHQVHPDFVQALEPRLMLAATKVIFTSASQSFTASGALNAITVQLQDNNGNAQNAAAPTTITLSTSSNGGAFYDPGHNVESSVTIPAGSNSATFEYSDTVAGTPTLGVASTALAPALQTETVAASSPSQLAFTNNPTGDLQNTNSTTLTVVMRDVYGNPAASSAAVTVSLASTSSGGTFSTGTSVSIPAGSTSATFTYKDTLVGTPTITASNLSLTSATQQQTIYSATTVAVKPDPSQTGTYASTPPGGANANIVYGTDYDWINRPANSSLPTNDWWTLILKSGFAGSLYSLPQKLFTQGSGVTVSGFTGINSINNNIGYAGEQTVAVGGNGVTFTRDALVNYGDWDVQFRMEQATNKYIDVTAVQGSPISWYEFTNVAPTLSTGTAGSYGTITDGNGTSFGNGNAYFTTDHFEFTKAGVTFGVFAPAGTTFVPSTGGFTVAFSGSSHYLAVATLPNTSAATMNTFYSHAYTIPRNTTYGYSTTAASGSVNTTWNVTTAELKSGAGTDIIQGWLPTNYRDIKSGPAIVSGITYPSIYGTIETSIGSSFTIVQPTNGLNFLLPAPTATGGASDYNVNLMESYLSNFQLGNGADSYGGETTLSQAAELTLMAKQMGDTANYNRLLTILRNAVTNFLSYPTLSTDQYGINFYFTYYPKDHALIAYPPAFGSEHYTDIHFHYGYLTSSAAVLAMLDPSWAAQYGAMATAVAKSYANWDRSDTSEPYFRTFNPWDSHSYADGLGDSLGNQGNDQESASEAVQSWQGLVLLGQALGNQAMTDAGIMGYTMETKSETEYWLNVAHQDLNPAGFPANTNTAINADFTREHQTFFGGSAKYVLGIEGLPDWPSMDFLGKYNTAMQAEIDTAVNSLGGWSGVDPSSLQDATNWLGIILGMQGQVNPQKAADQFAQEQTLNNYDYNNPTTGVFYYLTYSNRNIGLRDFSYHMSVPIGAVYTSTSGVKTYIAYNSSTTAQTVQVLDANNNVVDTFTAAPRTVTITNPLPFAYVSAGVLHLNGTSAADVFGLSQSGSTITATLGSASLTFAASAISGLVITGGGGNDTLNITSGTYTFTADASADGTALALNVAANAVALFNTTQHLRSLDVAGSAALAGGADKTIVTAALTVEGTLDLHDDGLILTYTGSTPYTAVQNLIKSARDNGAWDGLGITSTTAKTANPADTTLGIMESNDYQTLHPGSTFDGQTLSGTAILIKYTYYGDANFDGQVNFDDYTKIDAGYTLSKTGWINGDFNNSGAVNFDDYSLIDTAFTLHGAQILFNGASPNVVAKPVTTPAAPAKPTAPTKGTKSVAMAL